ncbi:MAG: ribose ABC transporter permease [Spirochaetia bacterium]|jgi:ribose transport system permease protein|nr:ribose ABC transporter permease [Spirochaetia bacterium]
MKKSEKINGYGERFGLIIAFFIMIITISFLSDRFLTLPNILNILRQSSINGIIAVGMTMVILTAGIDLSVGSILGLTAVITADLLHSGIPVFLAILLGLLLGFCIGFVNGLLITKFKIPPFIATLGMMTLARGLAFTYTQGKPITGLNESFRVIGTGMIGSIPLPVIIAALVFFLGYLFLKRSRHGENIYALGNNETAAEFSGIPVKRYISLVYALSGFLSALAGMILIGRLDSAQPIIGQGYEFDAIAAVVVGGTSFTGGHGSVWGTLIGVLIIAVINNGLNLLDVSSFYEQVVKGVVIAIALLLHRLAQKKN